jgi:hypothetical protein
MVLRWPEIALGWLEMVEVNSLRAGRETVCPGYVVVGNLISHHRWQEVHLNGILGTMGSAVVGIHF